MDCTDFSQVPIILNVTQLAKVLRISKNNSCNLIHGSHIEAVEAGRQYWVSKGAVLKFLGVSAA